MHPFKQPDFLDDHPFQQPEAVVDTDLMQQDRAAMEIHAAARAEYKKLAARKTAEKDLAENEDLSRRAVLRQASKEKSRPPRFLWHNRIPLNEITLIGGKGGIGKSQILCLLIAWITTGTMKGEFHGIPRNVIYVVNEDDIECTVMPRLRAAGADLERVFFLDIEHEGELARLSLKHDLTRVAQAIREVNAVAVMFDPLSSNLAVKSNSGDEVRPVMEAISRMASEEHVAIIGLGHTRKGQSSDFLEAIMGSSELGNVLRAAIGVMRSDADDGAIVMSQEKNNLATMDVTSYEFKIVPHVVRGEWGEVIHTSRVAEMVKTDKRVGDMIADTDRMGESKTKVAEARDFVMAYLSDPRQGGEAPKKDIIAAARSEGIDQRAIDRAGVRLKVVSSRVGGYQAGVMWRLP